jgi:hypothetical protein
VKAALARLTDVLSSIGSHFEDSDYVFDMAGALGGAECLLPLLRDGLRAREEREERIARGELSAIDLAREEI